MPRNYQLIVAAQMHPFNTLGCRKEAPNSTADSSCRQHTRRSLGGGVKKQKGGITYA
jgi:hypothetical protein